MKHSHRLYGAFLCLVTVCGALYSGASRAEGPASSVVSWRALAGKQPQVAVSIDFANARPAKMPLLDGVGPIRSADRQGTGAAGRARTPGVRLGKRGSGELQPVQLLPSGHQPNAAADTMGPASVTPNEYGETGHPFTTSRVDPSGLITTAKYPFSTAGKFFFTDGADSYVCSAALIREGIVVTAAHCVAAFAEARFYSNFTFVPAYTNGKAPFGAWQAADAWIMTSYYDGTDSCAFAGVVCASDVAVIVLQSKTVGRRRPVTYWLGDKTGYLGYGWDGYGFVNGQAQITQLGYPVALDAGGLMERTDSLGFVDEASAFNTVIGSLQTGGSSGGPWAVNLGIAPQITGDTFPGYDAARNTVVGVTSWGYVDPIFKQQGASPFTSDNIVLLIDSACAGQPTAPGPCD